ncbi:bile acid:sodium symporter [Pandoraea pneumonica]|uniref:Bile acid:sodium symporter n=1 Tax=Pandoraea pneumonica TaxID=2508299 RepID=A0A5E4WHE8_9BURK|nr:bile acid:sodium symporter family protein [Pandoraea pneumonica]VVE23024.1 bile acid:sodium symporter [Pandoraea pneumonica]
MARPRFLPDNFTLMLVATVALASFLPAHGEGEVAFNLLTNVAIAALFFLHGAKLSREAVLAGATHWRLHLLVFASTFAVFPLVGVVLKPVLSWAVTPELYLGILFLCTLPATVQSAIAFTSIARGNVPAAVCSASASSLFGIFITPVLVGLIVVHHDGNTGASPFDSIGNIMLQLLVPFIAGQLSRKAIGGWVERNRALLKFVDQGSILLVVYTAFSEAVNTGLWHQIPPLALLGLLGCCAVILAVMLAFTTFAARWLGFSREDEITIVFCGSKKSLASGIPMAKVLFATGPLGAIVLPLMLFHQMQLMVCAVLAQRYATKQRAAQAKAGKAGVAKAAKSDASANAGAGR